MPWLPKPIKSSSHHQEIVPDLSKSSQGQVASQDFNDAVPNTFGNSENVRMWDWNFLSYEHSSVRSQPIRTDLSQHDSQPIRTPLPHNSTNPSETAMIPASDQIVELNRSIQSGELSRGPSQDRTTVSYDSQDSNKSTGADSKVTNGSSQEK